MLDTMPLQWYAKLFILVLGTAQLGGTGTVKPTPAAPASAPPGDDDPWTQTYRPGAAPPAPPHTQQQAPTLQLRSHATPADDTDPEPQGGPEPSQPTSAQAGDPTSSSSSYVGPAETPAQQQPPTGAAHSDKSPNAAHSATFGDSKTTLQTGSDRPPTRGATVPSQPDPIQETQPSWPEGSQTQQQQPEPSQLGQAPWQQVQQHQWGSHQTPHPQGWMPGRTPKDTWGYYAPAYDPDTDPWHADAHEHPQHPQQLQTQLFVRQGEQQHIPPAACSTTTPTQAQAYTYPYDPMGGRAR